MRTAQSFWRVLALVLLVGALWWLDLAQLPGLNPLRDGRDALRALVQEQPLASAALYFGIYLAVAALSIPGAAVLTLAGGALFGFGAGLLLVSFASSIGATLAFLASRHLLREGVQRRWGSRLAAIHRGLEREGAWYLLSLRLLPVVPFVAVNLAMGLTRMKTATFYLVSQLGMLTGTAVYVAAGTELAQLESVADVLSGRMLASFALLALLALAAPRGLARWRSRRVYARWKHLRPRRFDCNLVVIGAGAGGLVSAYVGAAAKARVTLVEAKASRTVTPDMALPMQRLAAAWVKQPGRRGTVQCVVVHRPQRSVPRSYALAPDVAAIPWPEWVTAGLKVPRHATHRDPIN